MLILASEKVFIRISKGIFSRRHFKRIRFQKLFNLIVRFVEFNNVKKAGTLVTTGKFVVTKQRTMVCKLAERSNTRIVEILRTPDQELQIKNL